MRMHYEISKEIAGMSDAERGQLHSRIEAMSIPAERKAMVHKHIMLLGLINKRKERPQ